MLEIITVIVLKIFMYLGYTIVGIRIKTLISKRFHAIIHIPLYTDFALDFGIFQVPVHVKNFIILFYLSGVYIIIICVLYMVNCS